MLRWKRSQFEIVPGDEPRFWPRESGLKNLVDFFFFFWRRREVGPPSPHSDWYRMFLWVQKAVACSWSLGIRGSVFSAAPGEHFLGLLPHICLAFYPHLSALCTNFFYPLRIYEIKMNKLSLNKIKQFRTMEIISVVTFKTSVFRIPVIFCGESR